jgi:L-aspartate semialdehyde sulfurtransferase
LRGVPDEAGVARRGRSGVAPRKKAFRPHRDGGFFICFAPRAREVRAVSKTLEEINSRIEKGEAVVLSADEMTELVRSEGAKSAAKKVDVVTTGTFGPMCSSGAFLNFGHADPPIRMSEVWLNNVPACAGIAAVDVYVGATATSVSEGISYGGAHVIQDLVDGKRVKLVARSPGTDCYPGKSIETWVDKETINQAFLFNPRNAYQNYACATNTSERTMYTYMGILLPSCGNATYSSAGQLSPLLNDPYYRTIGAGTRIFLGGSTGLVAWHGTQHSPSVERSPSGTPKGPAGTLAVIGDLKRMDSRFLRGARFHRYGVTLYVGIGIPIPVLDEDMAAFTGVSDSEIVTKVLDYSEPVRAREPLREVSYAELRSGTIDLDRRKVHTAPLSSYSVARRIADTLKGWIQEGGFLLSRPVEPLPGEGGMNPLEEREEG